MRFPKGKNGDNKKDHGIGDDEKMKSTKESYI